MSSKRHRNLYGPGPPGVRASRRSAPRSSSTRSQAMTRVSGVRPGGLQRVWGAAYKARNKAGRDYRAGDKSALGRGRSAVRVMENMRAGTRRAPRRS